MSRSVARLLIVWHSSTGGSAAMARAAHNGAADIADTQLLSADQASAQDMLDAQAYLFVGPENLAALSGIMKDFFDRCYYPLLGQIEGRPYASMICAGSDGSAAARQIARIATGWRLRQIAEPLIMCTHAQTAEAIAAPKIIAAEELARCRELGAMIATGIDMGIF
jgi:NAD(P)H-dependent FMN reductase